MITVNGFKLAPDIFPDGTSQLWKLPQEVLTAEDLQVDWRFESEREIVDLTMLRELMPAARLHLYIPFMPYSRQDKDVSNDATFALHAFAPLLNRLRPFQVTTLDVHNKKMTSALISALENVEPWAFQKSVAEKERARILVYPDAGAKTRYESGHANTKSMTFEKTRDPATGQITGHRLASYYKNAHWMERFLIVDDICDGGATFISVAKSLRAECIHAKAPRPRIALFVTHGIFSKGRGHLLSNGIDEIYTTDSLPKNKNLPGVMKV